MMIMMMTTIIIIIITIIIMIQLSAPMKGLIRMIVCLRNISINSLHKGYDDDDDDNNIIY